MLKFKFLIVSDEETQTNKCVISVLVDFTWFNEKSFIVHKKYQYYQKNKHVIDCFQREIKEMW